ncbi:MAG: MarC family protein [Caldithrix sp.]|nr:MarC family protein [Caldithrix sp.]
MLNSMLLMLVLLNPFLIILYLLDLVEGLDSAMFRQILIRAAWISFSIFSVFALLGDAVFRYVFQSSFASFQIFGGIIFLIIGARFVFSGYEAIRSLRGNPEHIAGSIAMPIMVGPGTVSASILAGKELFFPFEILSIFLAIVISIAIIMLLKKLHDIVKPRNEKIIEYYVEISSKIGALIVGTFAVEMLMKGIKNWIERIGL